MNFDFQLDKSVKIKEVEILYNLSCSNLYIQKKGFYLFSMGTETLNLIGITQEMLKLDKIFLLERGRNLNILMITSGKAMSFFIRENIYNIENLNFDLVTKTKMTRMLKNKNNLNYDMILFHEVGYSWIEKKWSIFKEIEYKIFNSFIFKLDFYNNYIKK